MSILKEYVKGDIKTNRKNYNSTITTIFLAVLILSTFVFGISSYYKSYRDVIANSTGGYHFRIVNRISNQDANNLVSNRHIKKIGFFNTKELNQGFGSKEKTKLFQMDDNALSIIRSWLKKGTLPKDGEVIISNDMSKETGKSLGDNIELDDQIYNISGIYCDTTYEYQEFYNIFLNVNQANLLQSEEELSPFIWYKNIFRTYNLSEELMENLDTKGIIYNYNLLYLDRSFVFDPEDDLLKDHTFQVMVFVLFLILIILFYSIIVNLFLVQESKSIIEYSKLKSIGATNNDINKIIQFKAIYISQIPILLGIFSSFGLVKLLFFIINKVEQYFLNAKEIFSNTMYLNLKFDFKLVAFVYIISFLIIYLSTKKPIKKLKNNSILNGLKGNIKSRNYKKYDLKYTGNIEKDLSKQFYKNSKRNFKFTGITLKIGFLLMAFIMTVITYYSIDEKYNRVNKYETYGIQGQYATLKPINKELIKGIKSLNINELINFRKQYVYLDFDYNIVSNEYKDTGSLNNLEEEIISLENIRVEIFGIEDDKFKELVLKKGLNPNDYIGNKVVLLNTMGDKFNIPISEMKSMKFLKDDINKLSLSEYGSILDTRGYEFTLDVEDKIDTPLFDYNIRKDSLNAYMPKSQYVKLFSNFLRIADLDQYEYISVKTDNIKQVQNDINHISLEYFKENDYGLVSKLDEEMLVKKRSIIGNILAIFFSIFFVIVGFSNCYFSFYNLFLKRRDEFLLYKAIGMNEKLLEKVLQKERNKILFNFISSMPFIVIAISYITSTSSKIFGPIDILLNLNYPFILGYIFIIYISISQMYNRYIKEIMQTN
ncbi:MAG: hypothetical protein KZY61_10905 [Clostridiaceae bacterium]|nr:hypothetical protein [Clostridiaceae bacterium]MBW4860166.1 hypothetical protein [Clostridiaceae bacterium]MBW4869143.1 hypothetical protein [Clostridiaceae bacterium]